MGKAESGNAQGHMDSKPFVTLELEVSFLIKYFGLKPVQALANWANIRSIGHALPLQDTFGRSRVRIKIRLRDVTLLTRSFSR